MLRLVSGVSLCREKVGPREGFPEANSEIHSNGVRLLYTATRLHGYRWPEDGKS